MGDAATSPCHLWTGISASRQSASRRVNWSLIERLERADVDGAHAARGLGEHAREDRQEGGFGFAGGGAGRDDQVAGAVEDFVDRFHLDGTKLRPLHSVEGFLEGRVEAGKRGFWG